MEVIYTVKGYEDGCRNCPDMFPNFDDIIKFFADNGYKVSKRGLKHNFWAWLSDYKSGYRCSTCFIFTPCGCNPLSFSVMPIKKGYCTYEC